MRPVEEKTFRTHDGVDLFLRKYRPRLIYAGGIADAGGVVADNQHGLVAEVLELPQFPQHDRMAQVQVRAGRVHAQLDAEWPAGSFSIIWRGQRVRGADLKGPAHPQRGQRIPTPHTQFFAANGETCV